VRVELCEQRRIVIGIDDHRHVRMILGGGTDHRGSANVDVLDASFVVGTLRNRRLERVEVDDQKIDRPNSVRFLAAVWAALLRIASRRHAPWDAASSRAHPSSRESP